MEEKGPDTPEWQEQPLIARADGSYVIIVNELPYHVPDAGEHAALYAEVHAFALANPFQVQREAAVPPPGPIDAAAALRQSFTAAIQRRLDDFARTRNYDSALTCASYAASTVPKFAAEAACLIAARDASWAKGYEILDAVQAGTRPLPSWEEVAAELPVLQWP